MVQTQSWVRYSAPELEGEGVAPAGLQAVEHIAPAAELQESAAGRKSLVHLSVQAVQDIANGERCPAIADSDVEHAPVGERHSHGELRSSRERRVLAKHGARAHVVNVVAHIVDVVRAEEMVIEV